MSLGDILENETRDEIARIRAQAQERSAAILAAARERATALLDSQKRSLDAELQAGLTRARSAADLEANAQRLGAADQVQARAFQQAEAELRGAPASPQYPQILARLIQEASAALPNAEVVEVHPNEVTAAQMALAQLGVQAQVRPNPAIETGVRLVGRGGKTSVQNTLLGRLQSGRDSLTAEVARLLNG
ncbi:V-type ATP synthase subunit E [Deinococcus apachensis]|uniref:V-type ATP synthase subunit E n=1 Tax=Deinococcus apachensis TaxID=309886 RepID=UPI00037C3DC6|nr:V-type ATP synthase subunit E [Deinococcus apachensis]